ncbi:11195_t:CDS:2, partial [Scutellospora calospora]
KETGRRKTKDNSPNPLVLEGRKLLRPTQMRARDPIISLLTAG